MHGITNWHAGRRAPASLMKIRVCCKMVAWGVGKASSMTFSSIPAQLGSLGRLRIRFNVAFDRVSAQYPAASRRLLQSAISKSPHYVSFSKLGRSKVVRRGSCRTMTSSPIGDKRHLYFSYEAKISGEDKGGVSRLRLHIVIRVGPRRRLEGACAPHACSTALHQHTMASGDRS